ncbi:uncharacterized protein FOMMEDRAFT_17457 [Fomitiporia mediterranea MF3/22]|uniref:uncharacterized protein n=1 Tax=Fomitiporia mediterranea (strain MF3/22) TaxID=694068 RepID=UPI00044086FB|nr:uncharacterized protein FOMMEDRAFT_17457 [Fomitiporia mediterranea MF3/22]EJD07023.1 hypothetical protein FOMMEDRAFT_17457 [Fomitiporia mediterranea MF3/22]
MFMAQLLIFFLTFAALVLLTLISVSTPVVKPLYFLHTAQAGGVRFGEWGWCLDDGSSCSERALGIDWSPELTPWLTKAIVVYPIAAGITFIALVSFIPPLCSYRRERMFPSPAFTCLALVSFIASLVALVFALILFVTALRRFHALGFEASLGPNIWMSIGATAALAIVTMGSGCGCAGRGRFSRASPYLAYNV